LEEDGFVLSIRRDRLAHGIISAEAIEKTAREEGAKGSE